MSTGRTFENVGIRRGDATPVLTKTDNYSVTGEDHDRLIIINATASKAMLLPAASSYPGLKVTFTHLVASTSGNGHLLDVTGTDRVRGLGITDASAKGLVCTQGTSRIGDSVTVVSDGSSVWYAINATGTWAVEG